MNQKQWKEKIKNKQTQDDFWYWRNKAKKYFNLQKGYVIHHLRDTTEQQTFNNLYYERWGFDFDGVMKYCICITLDEHRKLHRYSEDSKKRMSEAAKNRKDKSILKGRIVYNNGIRKIILKPGEEIPEGFVKGMLVTENMKGHHLTKEAIEKQWKTKRERGTDKKSLETRKKMSEAAKRYKKTEEHLKHIREAAEKRKGCIPVNKGIKQSAETCKKISEKTKEAMSKPEVQAKIKAHIEKLKDIPYWTNGIKNKRSIECPGKGWYLGYTVSKKNIGNFWWNNGKIETKSKECPGEGWIRGRLNKIFYVRKG